MEPATPSEVTKILAQVQQGDAAAMDRLMPLVYDNLRSLAEAYLRKERPGHTLQATALVNEAYIKLVGRTDVAWQGRAHFFAAAAQAIRRILVDHARGKSRDKRGGDRKRIPLDASAVYSEPRDINLVALDEALAKLGSLNERHSRVVELRFFGGLTTQEVAAVLGVSSRTVETDWSMAKAWLLAELAKGDQV